MSPFSKKSQKFVLDHTFDDINLKDMSSQPNIGLMKDDKPHEETEEERKMRIRSHWIAYTTMFIMTIGFSIVLSGVWNYMRALDPSIESKTAMGWVVASNPLGQMLASPLLGIWSNKIGQIRIPTASMIILYIIGNFMYSILYAFQEVGSAGKNITYGMMIISRFIVGVSSGNVTLTRSYLASSTTLQERTVGMAIIAAAQALGFVVGPAIQTVLKFAVPEEITFGVSWFVWNEYTSCGLVAAGLGIINFVILMPCFFTEYNLSVKESARMKASQKEVDKVDSFQLPSPDGLALASVLFGFFVAQFIYTLIETLATPFVIDQYSWDDDTALVVVGIGLSIGGILSTLMFAGSGYLAKIFQDRKVIIVFGFIPLIIGTLLFLPWGGDPIGHPDCTDKTESPSWAEPTLPSAVNIHARNSEDVCHAFRIETIFGRKPSEVLPSNPYWIRNTGSGNSNSNCPGCPEEQDWCEWIPPLPEAQLAVAFSIVMLAYPSAVAMAQAILSKLLGPKPQGLWMGILTSCGSLARVLGPIFVSYVYVYLGTRYTFGILALFMLLACIELTIMYPRLVPMKLPDSAELFGLDGPAAMIGH